MNLRLTLVMLALILSLSSFVDTHENMIFYHKIRFTATSIELVDWNTRDTLETAFVKEYVDGQGRTKELRFYNHEYELNWAGSGFYGGPIIKYDYDTLKLIETFFSSENEIANDFKTSEVPYRHIYHLDSLNRIIEIEQIYKIDFMWTTESLEETIEHLEFYKNYPDEGSELQEVFGYNYAFAKMNGVNPKKKK